MDRNQDARLKAGPDAPSQSGGFSMGEDEFIRGLPGAVTENILDQCHRTGAGHFLAVFHWGAGYEEVAAAHRLFGERVVRKLRA